MFDRVPLPRDGQGLYNPCSRGFHRVAWCWRHLTALSAVSQNDAASSPTFPTSCLFSFVIRLSLVHSGCSETCIRFQGLQSMCRLGCVPSANLKRQSLSSFILTARGTPNPRLTSLLCPRLALSDRILVLPHGLSLYPLSML